MRAFLLLFLSLASHASDFPKVDKDLQEYDRTVVKKNLAHMTDVDQYMRNFSNVVHDHAYTDEEKKYFSPEFMKRWQEVDDLNTIELKGFLKKYSWITISEFGKQADDNAWLIVQHADHDWEFQKEVLRKLSELYLKGETSPKNYAYLFDRVAASWSDPSKRKPQRYGTQGTCTGPAKWEPIEMEDPTHIDERRASVGLPPMNEYLLQVQKYCT